MANEVIEYNCGDHTMKSYLALPAADGPRPAVVVVHEWWGLNDYVRGRADMLTELGYVALAVDMYGAGATADNPDDAGALMTAAMPEAGARFQAAVDQLASRAEVAQGQIAAIGYCFGGAVCLAMARAGMDLAGVASFHGALETESPAVAGAVKAKVRVYHGNDDAMVSLENAEALQKEMDAAGADYEFVGYDGAGHGFTSREADTNNAKFGLPVGYNQAADEDSWQRLQKFLQSLFA
jgi:dienelactone hydrolase